MNHMLMQGFADRLTKEAGTLRRGILGGIATGIGAGLVYAMNMRGGSKTTKALPGHEPKLFPAGSNRYADPNVSRGITASSSVEEKVKDITSQQLGINKSSLTSQTRFRDLGGDSLDTVELIMAIEGAFNIDIDDNIAEHKILNSTIRDAVDYIKEQLKK